MPSFNLENKITWMELAPSLQELFKNLQSQIITERDRAIQREKELDKKIDDETKRAKAAEKTLQDNIDKEAQDRKDAIAKIKNSSGIGLPSGFAGQVIKLNESSDDLIADDDFRECRVVNNSSDQKTMEAIPPIDLATVFNSWYRFAHFNNAVIHNTVDKTDSWDANHPDALKYDGQNRNDSVIKFSDYYDWDYNSAKEEIEQKIDGFPVCGFINDSDIYKDYYIKIKAHVGWDDDNIMLICGYTKDSSGTEHTLMLVRGAGRLLPVGYTYPGMSTSVYVQYPPYPDDTFDKTNNAIDTMMWWALVYDFGNATQHVLISKDNLVGAQPTLSKAQADILSNDLLTGGTAGISHLTNTVKTACYMSLTRQGKTIIGETSDFDNNGNDLGMRSDLRITWTLPKSKPSSMSASEYNNLKKMFASGGNRVGFGVRSGQPSFKIIEQHGIFEDSDIINIDTGEVERYDSSSKTWKKYKSVEEKLPSRIFLYNKTTKKFFFYYFKGKYSAIVF